MERKKERKTLIGMLPVSRVNVYFRVLVSHFLHRALIFAW